MIEVKLNETTTWPIEIHGDGYLRVSLTLDEAREVANGIFRHLGVRCRDQTKVLKENLESLEADNARLVDANVELGLKLKERAPVATDCPGCEELNEAYEMVGRLDEYLGKDLILSDLEHVIKTLQEKVDNTELEFKLKERDSVAFRCLGCSDQAKVLKENLELHEKVEALEAINAGLVGPVFHIQESGGVRILKKKNRKLKKKAKRMARRLELIKELLK